MECPSGDAFKIISVELRPEHYGISGCCISVCMRVHACASDTCKRNAGMCSILVAYTGRVARAVERDFSVAAMGFICGEMHLVSMQLKRIIRRVEQLQRN